MGRIRRWFQRRDRAGNLEAGAVLGVLSFDRETCVVSSRPPRWRIEPVVAWYDAWIGVYVDREKRRVYVFPCPCVGFRVYWG
jgi:hypothetical protein